MSIVRIKDLSISFEGNKVLDKLSLEVEDNDYLCIIGENGSGKTTLIKCILGLLKADEGEIEINDEYKNKISYLPQQSDIQKDFPATVKEVVLSGCINRLNKRLFYNQEDKNLAIKMMEKVNISDLANQSFSSLSGGQKQRTLLARALCADSKILILDEPISGLDPDAVKQLYEMIEKLNKEGMTIIMISHDLNESLKYCKHILKIDKTYYFGSKEDYLRRYQDA